MKTPDSFRVRAVDWKTGQQALRAVREAVFVREQSVPAEMEWDALDAVSQHVVAEASGAPIGTGRLLPDGHIGRMAVLAAWRGRGVGSALLDALLQLAGNAGHLRVMLSAQIHAQAFYRRFGFVPEGPPYMEAGIAHIAMALDIATFTKPPPQR